MAHQIVLGRYAENFLFFILCVKGAAKLYFIDYSSLVIILLSTGLYKSAFSTDSFGKLGFGLSAVFALCKFNVTFINFIALP